MNHAMQFILSMPMTLLLWISGRCQVCCRPLPEEDVLGLERTWCPTCYGEGSSPR